MNLAAKVYISAVGLSAAIFFGALPWHQLVALTRADVVGLLSFGLLAITAQVLSLTSQAGRHKVDSSIVFLPLLACVFLFPPIATVVVVACVELFTQFLKRRQFWKGMLNVSQGVLAIGFGAILYVELSRTTSGFQGEILPFFAAVGAVASLNLLLVSAAFSLVQRKRFKMILQQMAGPAGGNLLYFVLASPIAIIAALLYEQLHVIGVVVIVFPLLLVRYSYLSKLQLQAANEDLLRALVKAIETRDPYTSGHSLRVSKLSRMIAEDMGLPHRKVTHIENAGLLHDIGKIESVYADMIKKAAPLEEEERRLINTHATKGAEMLESLSMVDRDIIRAVRHHHERYDGGGYPDRLRGDDIPIGARIIMVSDSVDAMLSDRPYRSALSPKDVEAELSRCAGTQFDPKIVHAILTNRTIYQAVALLDSTRSEATALT